MARTETETTEAEAGVSVPHQPTRDELRKVFFDKEKTTAKVIPITYNGVTFEFRQPTIEEASKLQGEKDEGDNFIIRSLIAFSYIPGTDEPMFEFTDYDRMLKMPANGEFQKAVALVADALGISVDEKVKN